MTIAHELGLKSEKLIAVHIWMLSTSDGPQDFTVVGSGTLWEAIRANHHLNSMIWSEEDLARRTNAADSEIAKNKRTIDGLNQRRNDTIVQIDRLVLDLLATVARAQDARMNSETVGAMIDRLSILSLKVHHMHLQTLRTDVSVDHIQLCSIKRSKLTAQRADLSACLDAFLFDAVRGIAYFNYYHHFKMYNDPNLNPWMYDKKISDSLCCSIHPLKESNQSKIS